MNMPVLPHLRSSEESSDLREAKREALVQLAKNDYLCWTDLDPMDQAQLIYISGLNIGLPESVLRGLIPPVVLIQRKTSSEFPG